MTRRFQIEDIIAQNEQGITYRCIDAETADTVVLRRFFPFGPEGDGLSEEEAAGYRSAIQRLVELRHPALRQVITGDCDPVDGMPFIVNRWVEGVTLEEKLAESGALTADQTHKLLDEAIQASEQLSTILAEQALWVDTDPASIVLEPGPGGWSARFWISPLKWLGEDETARGTTGLATLAETCLSWSGGTLPPTAGRGLAGWIKQVKTQGTAPPLAKLRELLRSEAAKANPAPAPARATQHAKPSPQARTAPVAASPRPGHPSQPAPAATTAPARQAAPPAKKSPVGLIISAITFLLATGGGAAWFFLMGPGMKTSSGTPAKKEIPAGELSALDILETATPPAESAPAKPKTSPKKDPAKPPS